MQSFSLQNFIRYLPSQDNIGCCTASASLLAAEIMMAMTGKDINFSRLFVYYMSRKIGNRLGQKGAELSTTMEALQTYGAALHNSWPFRYKLLEVEPPLSSMEEAALYKVNSFQRINIDVFKDYIISGMPIVIGMHTGRKFWRIKGPIDRHNYCPINNTDNRNSLGHAMTIVGFDDNIAGGSWIIANSLGPMWGDKGFAAIPYTCGKDIGESFVITCFAGICPDRKISGIDK